MLISADGWLSVVRLHARVSFRRGARRPVGEEIPQNQDLTDTDDQNAKRLHDRPPQHTLVDVFAALATSRLAQTMVRLEVGDLRQRFVDLCRGLLHLRHARLVLFESFEQRRLLADLQIHVDQLVREGRELVAKAHCVHAGNLHRGESRPVMKGCIFIQHDQRLTSAVNVCESYWFFVCV